VDPTTPGAVAEVQRCLNAGHRGVKLHPRAERFAMSHPGVDALAAVAAERRVPLLVHAGRGIPSLGPDTLDLMARHPGLVVILAHCAISDLPLVAREGPPSLLVDTSWWNITDHLALYAWADAGRIVYASDMPYGRPGMVSTITARAAVQAGLSAAAVQAVFGGTIRRVLAGEAPEPLGERGTEPDIDLGLLRVAGNLQTATAAVLAGDDPTEPFELARRAVERPSASYEHVYRALTATLDVAAAGPGRRSLLVVALAAALTPDVPVPDL